jgi:hypothetical protein
MSKTQDVSQTTDTVPVYVVQRRNRTPALGTRELGFPTHAPDQAGYESWLETMEELEDLIDVSEFGVGDRVATMQVHQATREVQDYQLTVAVDL